MKVPEGYILTEQTVDYINDSVLAYVKGVVTEISLVKNLLSICNEAITIDRESRYENHVGTTRPLLELMERIQQLEKDSHKHSSKESNLPKWDNPAY